MKATLIGGPTAVIEYAGIRFITDPTFDSAGTEYDLGIVTLKKTTGPAMTPDEAGPVDTVLLTHDQHADNLDNAGRELLPTAKRVLTTVSGAGRLGGSAKGLANWQTVELGAPDGRKIKITATPCRHGPPLIEKITGDVIGFVLEAEDEPTLYLTGDTVFYKGVADVAEKFSVDFIAAFAGAAKTRGPFELTMSVRDLLETAQAFPDALIMPLHFEGWEHFSQGLADVTGAFEAFGMSERLFVVEKGETKSFPQ